MSKMLKQLVLPDSLRELISLEFAYLHSRVITIASERAAQFESVAWNAYERCLSAISSASGLDDKTRAELTEFLGEQVRILTATAAKYSTEEEILTEIAVDEGRAGDPTQEDENRSSHFQPEVSQSADSFPSPLSENSNVDRRRHHDVANSQSGRPTRKRRKAATIGTRS